ncbi:hypothetical protein FHS66_003388 [Pacificitalea manganoxidans]|nr:hypothetical protein [Pacificitalea manganoxidans]
MRGRSIRAKPKLLPTLDVAHDEPLQFLNAAFCEQCSGCRCPVMQSVLLKEVDEIFDVVAEIVEECDNFCGA